LNAADTHMGRVSSGHSLADYGRLVRRRWTYVATILPACILLSVLIAYVLPPSYRATAVLMLQASSIPKEMISTTVRDVNDNVTPQEELELVRRRVMDPEALIPLVKEVDPYPLRRDLTPEAKAEKVSENTSLERVDPITGKATDASPAFSILYDNPDPVIAKKFARRIVDLYLTFNRRNRTEQATAAYEFLHSQAKDLEVTMVSMEQKLAGFKAQYGAALPEMQTHNLSRIDALQHDLETTQSEILVSQGKESQLQLQLNTISPSLTSSVGDWRVQLAKTRADLIDAQQKYTPAHPEVKRLQRAVADLQAQGSASMKVGTTAPDNPDYLLIKAQLDAAERELTSLRGMESRIRADMSTYERNLTTAPNVQREYTQLQRDYDNARTRYEDLQVKMKNAALAQTMETEQKGEKFTLLHNASVPDTPYFPNRLGIILLGVLLGCAFAFGAGALADASDPTVRGTSDLNALLDAAPLGAIPRMLNPADRRKRKLTWASALAAYAAATALVALVVLFAHP
jgi:protein tyrosine kinase modulator